MDGYAFLDDLSWDAFNEGTRLISSVEKYKTRFGYYHQQVAANKIYCNRENRRVLNLVRLARVVPYALLKRIMTFSAKDILKLWRLLMRFIQTPLGKLNTMNNEMALRLT